jgi:hypothetical protein
MTAVPMNQAAVLWQKRHRMHLHELVMLAGRLEVDADNRPSKNWSAQRWSGCHLVLLPRFRSDSVWYHPHSPHHRHHLHWGAVGSDIALHPVRRYRQQTSPNENQQTNTLIHKESPDQHRHRSLDMMILIGEKKEKK